MNSKMIAERLGLFFDKNYDDDGYIFERVFLDTALEVLRQKRGDENMKVSILGRMLFDGYAALSGSPKRLRNLLHGDKRKSDGLKRIQRLTLQDAYHFARVAEVDLPYLMLLAWSRFQSGDYDVEKLLSLSIDDS